jgi:DNA-binding response OmpR family regulator
MNTILVIDDNDDYRESLMEILEFENYAALGAENGKIGWQIIRQHSPSLIICDVDMPIMNGVEVLQKTRADARLANIPFLMVSGQSREFAQRASHALAVDMYLAKPMDINALLATIAGFLNADASTA